MVITSTQHICDNSENAQCVGVCEMTIRVLQSSLIHFPVLSYIQAYDAIKKQCKEAGVDSPCRITSVSLRKYTATMTQVSSTTTTWT